MMLRITFDDCFGFVVLVGVVVSVDVIDVQDPRAKRVSGPLVLLG